MSKAIFRLDSDLYPNTITGLNKTGGELENGAFVKIGTIVDDALGKDTYELTKCGTGAFDEIGFVSSPSLRYDERENERDFVCEADELIRTYIPNKSTVGTFAKKHFSGVLVVGDLLEPKAGTTQLTKAGATPVNVVAKVEAIEDFEGQESIVIKFLK